MNSNLPKLFSSTVAVANQLQDSEKEGIKRCSLSDLRMKLADELLKHNIVEEQSTRGQCTKYTIEIYVLSPDDLEEYVQHRIRTAKYY